MGPAAMWFGKAQPASRWCRSHLPGCFSGVRQRAGRGVQRRTDKDRASRYVSPRGPESGTAVVEAALVAPLLIVALFGVAEAALAWRDHVALADATGEAARVAALHPSSITGWTPVPSMFSGEAAVITAISAGLGSARSAVLERVVVFVPTGPVGSAAIDQVPPRCRTADVVEVSDRCVIIGPEAFAAVSTSGLPRCGGDDCPWRQPAIDGTSPRYVGVYIRMQRLWLIPGLGAAGVQEFAVLAPMEGGSRVDR